MSVPNWRGRIVVASLLCCAMVGVVRLGGAQTTMHSATFWGDGSGKFVSDTCRILPHDCNVALNGTDALPILINPWEPVSINIHCVELVFLPNQPVSSETYLFAGNSYSPDVMVSAIPGPDGAARAGLCYPPGISFPFPAAAPSAAPNSPGQNDFALPHLDVHVIGKPGSWLLQPFIRFKYKVLLTVFYTKNPS
jgi:hypothetical protein